MRDGCPNCESVLQLSGNIDTIQECTSQVFEGLISIRDPKLSWVARWQRLDNYVPGTYATKVTGSVSTYLLVWECGKVADNDVIQLPEDKINSLEDSGVKYIPYASPLSRIGCGILTNSCLSVQARWQYRRGRNLTYIYPGGVSLSIPLLMVYTFNHP